MIDTILKHWRAAVFLVGFVPTVASPMDDIAKYSIIGGYSLLAYIQFSYSENKKKNEEIKKNDEEKEAKRIETESEETLRKEELDEKEKKIKALEKEVGELKGKISDSKDFIILYHEIYVRYRKFVLVEFSSEHDALESFMKGFRSTHGGKPLLSKEMEFLESLLVSKKYLYAQEKEAIDNVERDVPRRGDFR